MEVLGLLDRFLFLWGPPGSGKTLMLTLRAQRWVSEGGQVVILNMRHGSLGLPLGHLLQKQVCVLSVSLLVLVEFVHVTGLLRKQVCMCTVSVVLVW